MNILGKHIQIPTIALLAVLLCMPTYGPDYLSEYMSTVEANHAGFVCDHAGAESGHESRDGHQQIAHCHELDAPCETSATPVPGYSPMVSSLTSSDNGTLLDGYGIPFDIPPENFV